MQSFYDRHSTMLPFTMTSKRAQPLSALSGASTKGGIDPPAEQETQPNMAFPPLSEVVSSDMSDASSVSHSILTDYNSRQLHDVVTPKVSNHYSATKPRGSEHKLARSPHLQKAMDRILSRRSGSTSSSVMDRGIKDDDQASKMSPFLQQAMDELESRHYDDNIVSSKEKVKKQNRRSEESRESNTQLGNLLELFSRYENILDHLIRKNKRLRDYVNGETDKYDAAEQSLSSNEVLDTLVDLRRRSRSWKKKGNNKLPLILPPEKERIPEYDRRLLVAIPSLLQTSSESNNALIDLATATTGSTRSDLKHRNLVDLLTTSTSSDARSRVKAYARGGEGRQWRMPLLQETASTDEDEDDDKSLLYEYAYGGISKSYSIDPPAGVVSQDLKTNLSIDPVGFKDTLTGKRGELIDDVASQPRFRDGHSDSLPSVLGEYGMGKMNNSRKIHQWATSTQKRRLSSSPSKGNSEMEFRDLEAEQEATEMGKAMAMTPHTHRTNSAIMGKLLQEKDTVQVKHKSRKANAITRNAQKLREARERRLRLAAERREESLSPRQRASRRTDLRFSTTTGDRRVPPDGTTTVQPGHFLPVSPTRVQEQQRLHLFGVAGHRSIAVPEARPRSSSQWSQASSTAPSADARQLQSQLNQVYACSQDVRESQQKLKSDMLRLKKRYTEGDKYRSMIVRSFRYRNQDGRDEYDDDGNDHDDLNRTNTFEDLVRIGSADGSLGIFEADDGVIHIDEESLKSATEFPSEMYRKNDTQYHFDHGVIVIDDESSLSTLMSKERSIIFVNDGTMYPVALDLVTRNREGVIEGNVFSEPGFTARQNKVKAILQNRRDSTFLPVVGHRQPLRLDKQTIDDRNLDSSPDRQDLFAGEIEHLRDMPGMLESSMSTRGMSLKNTMNKGNSVPPPNEGQVEVQIDPQSFDDFDDDGHYIQQKKNKREADEAHQVRTEPPSSYEEGEEFDETEDELYYGDESDTNSLAVAHKGKPPHEAIKVVTTPVVGIGMGEKEKEVGSPRTVVKWSDECGVLPCGLAQI